MDRGLVTLIGMSIAYLASFVGMGLAFSSTAVALQVREGTQHGIVLESRRHHVIAALEQSEEGDIQRIGGILREHHAVGIAVIIEEQPQQTARLLDHLLRFHRELVTGTAGIHAVAAEKLVHGGVDHLRLGPAGGGIVEVVVISHDGTGDAAKEALVEW